MADTSTPTSDAAARYAALLQLLRTADVIWDASRVFFERWEVTPAQFNLLNLLADAAEGMTQSDLSRELLTHRSNITGLVDRLEDRGWVKRREQAGDRRAWRVMLTAVGRRRVADILPHYHRAAERLWEGAGPAEARRLLEVLQRIAGNAQAAAERLAGRSS
ncbi:MAG: MarR family transcriptional regulator [Verrucomicrobia bacterium]|nr:MarR family transcriptional regulator [Verrucomicrobiota bacterium]